MIRNYIVIVKVTIKDKSPSYLRYDAELGVVEQVEHLKKVVMMSIHLSLYSFMPLPESNGPRGGSDGFDDALGYKITHPDGYLKNYTFVKLD